MAVNFAASAADGGEIVADVTHNSNGVGASVILWLVPFGGIRKRQRHRVNLRPIVGPTIVGSMKGAFKSLFLLNCFASAFQRGILSPALHETIGGDETPFCHSLQSR